MISETSDSVRIKPIQFDAKSLFKKQTHPRIDGHLKMNDEENTINLAQVEEPRTSLRSPAANPFQARNGKLLTWTDVSMTVVRRLVVCTVGRNRSY